MTLIKSLLLGSAAGIVAVASAQAADLPTKKGAPAAEYVRICTINVDGKPIVGFTLPSTDTCLKISGYVTGQYTVANRASGTQDAFGMYTRGQVNFDAVSNTGAGPLLAHVELQTNWGNGFDSQYGGGPLGTINKENFTWVNSGYLTWAGLTAGKHGSFYDYFGGGPAWDYFVSPDHSGNPTNLIAYTVSAGGGFAATLSLEEPESSPAAGVTPEGFRSPDIVGQLKLTQGWGNAQLSAVGHDVANVGYGDTWGYGILGGVTFNIPNYAGADLKLEGVYAYDAIQYSGLTSPGSYNYGPTVDYPGGTTGGVLGTLTDTALTLSGAMADSSAWSVSGIMDLPLSPVFKVIPEASYGEVTYSAGSAIKADAFVGGGVLEWTPVKNLVFDLDLLYINGSYTDIFAAKADYSGFNGKLRIERDF